MKEHKMSRRNFLTVGAAASAAGLMTAAPVAANAAAPAASAAEMCIRDRGHAGAEKRAELLVLRIDLFLCQLCALIILWHPSPSLFWSRRSGRCFLLCGALALDLVQDDASCHRDIAAVDVYKSQG